MSRIEQKALSLLRSAVHEHGYTAESLAVDWAVAGLVADGETEALARRKVQDAWDANFKIWGPV